MHAARCNAACAHCSTACSPHRTEALSQSALLEVMTEASALARGPLKFGVTGGEPFLDFEGLRTLVRHGHSLGAEVGCVTNAYWASSPERAAARVRALKDDGLKLLAISTSRFHERWVARSRVATALRACADAGLQSVLKIVRVASDPDAAELQRHALAAGAERVEIIPVLPSVREGFELAESDLDRAPGLPAGPCPGMQMTVDWNAEVYACCTPGATRPYFSLGNLRSIGLRTAERRFYERGKIRLLREHGPIRFAREIIRRGLGHRLRPAYAGPCDLCTHIAGDAEMAAAADELGDRIEVRHLRAVLRTAHLSSTAPGSDRMKKKAKSPRKSGWTRKDRLLLSWKVFSDPRFREALLDNPKATASGIGLAMPDAEHAEILASRDALREYGAAIDTLVRLGKDVRKLWRSRELAIFGINRITNPGDWQPKPPHPRG